MEQVKEPANQLKACRPSTDGNRLLKWILNAINNFMNEKPTKESVQDRAIDAIKSFAAASLR